MIILDVETTGIDPHKNAMVEIAACDFNNPDNTFYSRVKIREGAEIDDFAISYNGFVVEEIEDKSLPDESEVLKDFLEWSKTIKDRTICGHNIDFDNLFMKAACKRSNLEWELDRRMVDQHAITYASFLKNGKEIPVGDSGVSKLGSDQVMEYVGLPKEDKPHKAMNGVMWELEAMHRLIYKTGKLDKFKEYPVPDSIC